MKDIFYCSKKLEVKLNDRIYFLLNAFQSTADVFKKLIYNINFTLCKI